MAKDRTPVVANKRYYYKSKEGKGYLNLKTPLSKEDAKKYVEITKEEFDALTVANPTPAPTAEEIRVAGVKKQIANLKHELATTDYQCLKWAEGWLTDEEYAPVKAQRQSLRAQINELEGTL